MKKLIFFNQPELKKHTQFQCLHGQNLIINWNCLSFNRIDYNIIIIIFHFPI